MANPKHLKILNQGVDVWNSWRKTKAGTAPNLKGANLRAKILKGIDFSTTNLSWANLYATDCSESDFRGAEMEEATIAFADFTYANMAHADLTAANLFFSRFRDVNFREAVLQSVKFTGTEIGAANFEKAMFGDTVFANVDLSVAIGLNSVTHWMPSSIGVDTLYKSKGKISEKFLLDAGVPRDVIEHFLPLISVGNPIQWHSCFISYSSKNEEFAKRFHSRMRDAGLRVWFAPEDMKGGRYSDEQIGSAIQLYDRLLLVLSEESIQSKWVEREIKKARKIERTEKRKKLFPITLMDYGELKKWECLDSDTGEDLAEEVRKYHIPDFSNWKNHDAFERAFARLEKNLRTSIGR